MLSHKNAYNLAKNFLFWISKHFGSFKKYQKNQKKHQFH